jgi:hypothetical protein
LRTCIATGLPFSEIGIILIKRVGLIPRSLLRDFIKVAGC